MKESSAPEAGSLNVGACVYDYVHAPEHGYVLVAVCGYEFGYGSVAECAFVPE